MKQEEFILKLKEKGLNLSSSQIEQFELYLRTLQEYNKVMDLTTIIEDEDVYEKHFYDSLLCSFKIDLNSKSLLDVGSGAGFPGIPLAIAYPNTQITLLEPTTKRCNFLEIVKNKLGLDNVTIINDRAENYIKGHEESFDVVTARAVSRLNILLELVASYLKVNGTFISLKGKIGLEELKEASNALKTLSLKLDFVQEEHLISNDDVRINIFIKKLGKTNPKYPRNYGQIKKRPL